MADYSYRIAYGHNVALASLTNVEDISGVGHPPQTQPPNLHPVRVQTLNGKVHGDGSINHVWRWGYMRMTGMEYVINTLCTVTGVLQASVPVTIYTRRRDLSSTAYRRYNASLVTPVPGEDYTVDDAPPAATRRRPLTVVVLPS